jgi:hypothetical protein
MRVRLEFHESPDGRGERFMDDMLAIATGADTAASDRILELTFRSLRDLEGLSADDLMGHLAGFPVWRWIEDLPVYRTPGDPCVVFTAFEEGAEDGPPEIVVYALGAIPSISAPNQDEHWHREILTRCRAAGLIDESEGRHDATE